jgi:hypothetical protein
MSQIGGEGRLLGGVSEHGEYDGEAIPCVVHEFPAVAEQVLQVGWARIVASTNPLISLTRHQRLGLGAGLGLAPGMINRSPAAIALGFASRFAATISSTVVLNNAAIRDRLSPAWTVYRPFTRRGAGTFAGDGEGDGAEDARPVADLSSGLAVGVAGSAAADAELRAGLAAGLGAESGVSTGPPVQATGKAARKATASLW